MTDTLQTIIKTVQQTSTDAIDLINKVDSFYNSAWSKLIIIGTVSFAVVGIIVPFMIQWYQKKTLNISEELLKKDIESQALKIKSEILLDINETLEKRIAIFESKIEELYASTEAKTFHLQGNGQLAKNLITDALSDFIIAASNYIKCNDYRNLQRVMKVISENCVPHLSAEELNDLKNNNIDLELLLGNLSTSDEKGIFGDIIQEIRFKISKLTKTPKA